MKLFRGCAVVAAALLDTRLAAGIGAAPLRRPARPHDEEVEKPWELQRELEQTVVRMRHLRATAGAETDTRGIARELEHLESTLAERAASGVLRSSGEASSADDSEKALQALDSEIVAVRASLCLEQGVSDADCEGFMRRACSSHDQTKKQSLPQDGAREAVVTPAMCQQFFLDHRKPEEEATSKSEEEAASKPSKEKVSAKPEKDAASKPSKKKVPPKQEEEAAPTLESGNGTILGGKKGRPLPSQGYNELDGGRLVEHDDNSTVTGDWMREFGAAAGHRDVYTICREHPDNEWCRIHAYHEPVKGSGYMTSSLRLVLIVALVLLCYL